MELSFIVKISFPDSILFHTEASSISYAPNAEYPPLVPKDKAFAQ